MGNMRDDSAGPRSAQQQQGPIISAVIAAQKTAKSAQTSIHAVAAKSAAKKPAIAVTRTKDEQKAKLTNANVAKAQAAIGAVKKAVGVANLGMTVLGNEVPKGHPAATPGQTGGKPIATAKPKPKASPAPKPKAPSSPVTPPTSTAGNDPIPTSSPYPGGGSVTGGLDLGGLVPILLLGGLLVVAVFAVRSSKRR